jgi:hypothetical protein
MANRFNVFPFPKCPELNYFIFFEKKAKGRAKVADKNRSQAGMHPARPKYRSGKEAWGNRSRKKAQLNCVWNERRCRSLHARCNELFRFFSELNYEYRRFRERR